MGAITDPVGNGLAIIALVGMLIVLGGSLYRLRGGYSLPITAVWWQMPVVALAGVGAAIYLVVMAVRPETAVCLPVADCRILQQSYHAYPFGMPV
ncbi:MAG: hypothetical protein KC421_00015, partial [Anaerolineales bacterium]|nr:hypothetical protein [Anaerolineales bacterium]